MLAEIGRYLSSENGFTIALLAILWVIVFDEKTFERVKKKSMKKMIGILILGFALQLSIGIIEIIMKYR